MNDLLKLINEIKFLANKWVMTGTIKAEMVKIINILKEIYISQLKWARSQMAKRAQIRISKSSPIKQQRD